MTAGYKEWNRQKWIKQQTNSLRQGGKQRHGGKQITIEKPTNNVFETKKQTDSY